MRSSDNHFIRKVVEKMDPRATVGAISFEGAGGGERRVLVKVELGGPSQPETLRAPMSSCSLSLSLPPFTCALDAHTCVQALRAFELVLSLALQAKFDGRRCQPAAPGSTSSATHTTLAVVCGRYTWFFLARSVTIVSLSFQTLAASSSVLPSSLLLYTEARTAGPS